MNMMDKMTKARTRLILDDRGAFYGNLAMKLFITEGHKVPTAGVNDKNELTFNPEYIKTLSMDETVGILAHEVLHLALLHPWRCGDRFLPVWSMAGDYVINRILLRARFTLPKKRLENSEYDDLCEEEIYKLLMEQAKNQQKKKQPKQKGQGSGQGQSGQGGENDKNDDSEEEQDNQNQNKDGNSENEDSEEGQSEGKNQDPDEGGCGGFEKAENTSPSQETKTDWKLSVKSLAKMCQGKLGSELERLVGELIDPEVPWREYLQDFLDRSARNDYNYAKTNKRFIASNVIMPTLISEELPEVIFVNDTSDSRDQKQMEECAGGVSAILEQFNTKCRVIHVDARVSSEEVFESSDLPIKLHPTGGGGTDFRPVFDYIKKQGYEPCCVIYFTDMWGTFPETEPEWPVLWITPTKNYKAPFGETVTYRNE